jgi:lysylphosphatidylglycerol synthetase-like protein (DUF2156 family)
MNPADTAASAVHAAVGAARVASASSTSALSASWTFDNWLVMVALATILATVFTAAIVVASSKKDVDLETRKVRFAAATFTGILLLFIFTAVLYFADTGGSRGGKEIFEKAMTAMTPLAGAIVGYLFGTRADKSSPIATGAAPSKVNTIKERE